MAKSISCQRLLFVGSNPTGSNSAAPFHPSFTVMGKREREAGLDPFNINRKRIKKRKTEMTYRSERTDLMGKLLDKVLKHLKKIIAYLLLLWIGRALWNRGCTWGAAFFVFFVEWIDFLISSMENLPLSVGGGGSSVRPSSSRPLLDLNFPPVEEAHPDLNLPPAADLAPVDEGPSSQTEDTDRQFDNPMISDLQRREELDSRLSAHVNIGNAGKTTLATKEALLEKQMLVEKEMESLLRRKGYSPESIFSNRHRIRGYELYPQGHPVTKRGLVWYLEGLKMDPEKSPPYSRVLRAIRDGELNLSKEET